MLQEIHCLPMAYFQHHLQQHAYSYLSCSECALSCLYESQDVPDSGAKAEGNEML